MRLIMTKDSLIFLDDDAHIQIDFEKKEAMLVYIDSELVETILCKYSIENNNIIEEMKEARIGLIEYELDLQKELELLCESTSTIRLLLIKN